MQKVRIIRHRMLECSNYVAARMMQTIEKKLNFMCIIEVTINQMTGKEAIELVNGIEGGVMAESTFATIDDYIANFPPAIQERLQALRTVIRKAAPDSEERMSWQMPTFYLHGNLVHFAVNKHHIGFYPAPSGVEAFLAESPEYKGTKGSIHFPHNKPLPLDLVGRVVRLRLEENIRDAEERLARKNM